MQLFCRFVLAAALGLPGFAAAQSADHASRHVAAGQQVAQAAPLVDGEIRRVDKEAKKLTIKHGPIPNIDMPAMTMVFQVKDPAMLDQVKAGDRVRFAAAKVGGAYTVTKIETAK
jgi:Cu(I)/Ag(I) efflux system protein CusF